MILENFIKFCLVGGSGLLLDMGVTYATKEWMRLNKYVANGLGFTLAATTNFFLNRWWTFRSESPDISIQYMKFVTIAVVGLAINTSIIYILHDRLRLNFYLSKIGAIGVVTIWNFTMNYIFTFA